MSDPRNVAFIQKAAYEAALSGHIFPNMAAAEAAVETATKVGDLYIYGASELAQKGNNLFGTKQHADSGFPTLTLPTKEYVNLIQAGRLPGAVRITPFDAKGKATFRYNADWVDYPDWASSFKDRMATLERLKGTYPHYANALAATDPITYVNEVSLTWSTGAGRAEEVISIYKHYFAV